MSNEDKQGLQDALEGLIDAYNLSTVVSAIADVCYEKSEHVQTNWQDNGLANMWKADAQKLWDCVAKLKT